MERGFKIISHYQNRGVRLPQRKTEQSAGYDFEAAESLTIPSMQTAKIPTGLKAFMNPNEALFVYARSSLYQTKQCLLVNSVAVIDADYYDNPGNEGHILITLLNLSSEPVTIDKGERFAQGIFQNYLKTGDDLPSGGTRVGGYGSTGR